VCHFPYFFFHNKKNFVALAKKEKNQISVFDYIIDLQNNSKKKRNENERHYDTF